MDTSDTILKQRIDEILHFVWDPIGVSSNGFPEARDEYVIYVDEIQEAIKNGAAQVDIVQLLDTIRTKRMALPSNPDNCLQAAKAIFAWVEYLNDEHPSR